MNTNKHEFDEYYTHITNVKMTPLILVDTDIDGVGVPAEHITNGKIVLDISPGAIQSFDTTEKCFSFIARFDGEPRFIVIPYCAVITMYSKEGRPLSRGKPTLTIVK